MTRRWLAVGGMLAAAAALLLLMPEKSDAQFFRRGGIGVNVGGFGYYSGPGYPYSSYGYGPDYSGWYSRSSYGWAPRTYYGWSSTPSYGRVGYVRGGSRGWDGPSYSSAWSPGYYGSSVGYPMSRSRMPYASAGSAPSYYGQGPEGAPGFGDNRSVQINLHVPPEAEVWLDDHKTQQRGMFRSFISPPLTPRESYTYQIRARWKENGQEVTRTRELRVQAGDEMNLDFMMPTEGAAAAPSGRTSEPAPTFPEGRTGERETLTPRPGGTPTPERP